MEWNVYRYDINSDKIETFNIFNHYSFLSYVKKAIRKYKDKEKFAEQLEREMLFYFWCKSEHELVIEIAENNHIFLYPWCGCREPEKVRIDVTNNENLDWVEFAKKHTERQIYGNRAKIDIHDQVVFVWGKFVDFCWDNKKKLLKME